MPAAAPSRTLGTLRSPARPGPAAPPLPQPGRGGAAPGSHAPFARPACSAEHRPGGGCSPSSSSPAGPGGHRACPTWLGCSSPELSAAELAPAWSRRIGGSGHPSPGCPAISTCTPSPQPFTRPRTPPHPCSLARHRPAAPRGTRPPVPQPAVERGFPGAESGGGRFLAGVRVFIDRLLPFSHGPHPVVSGWGRSPAPSAPPAGGAGEPRGGGSQAGPAPGMEPEGGRGRSLIPSPPAATAAANISPTPGPASHSPHQEMQPLPTQPIQGCQEGTQASGSLFPLGTWGWAFPTWTFNTQTPHPHSRLWSLEAAQAHSRA